MSYNRGDIYWADVKYEDADVIETRPILIWSETEMFCVSFKITSTNRGNEGSECQLIDWQAEGLSNLSSVRLDHIINIDKSKIKDKIGTLTYADMFRVQNKLAR